MKKRKFSMLLNIAVLCLCVCAIAIGVYSAKNASLNVTGTIGFTAHNCNVDISGYIYGHSTTKDGTPIAKPTQDSEKVYLKNGEAYVTETSPLKITGNSGALTFGDVFFSDMGETGDVERIMVMLTITNQSDFIVLLDDQTEDSTSYIVVCDTPLKVLYNKGDSVTLSYELHPAIGDDGSYINIDTQVDVSFKMSFSKLNTNISKDGFVFDNATNPTTITGVPENTNNTEILVIPSTFSDGTTVTKISGVYPPACMTNVDGYKKIVVLNGITSVEHDTFRNCTNLVAYTLPDSLTSFNKDSIGMCKNIKSVTIPSCATSMEFCYNFENLISLTIKNSVTHPDYLFWQSATKLLTINFNGTKEQCVNTVVKNFKSYNSMYEKEFRDFTIYCTDGQITKAEALQ